MSPYTRKKVFRQIINQNLSFIPWFQKEYHAWTQTVENGDLSHEAFATEICINAGFVLGWLRGMDIGNDLPEVQQKLWERFGVSYCLAADTPPPASLFPEGPSPKEIRSAFENLRSVLISGEFPFEELTNNSRALELMSAFL